MLELEVFFRPPCAYRQLVMGLCFQKSNRPFINPTSILPSLVAGALWASGMLGWFVANDNLSPAVSYPIIGSMPGLFSALWGVFYFGEIVGKRNLSLLACAMVLTC